MRLDLLVTESSLGRHVQSPTEIHHTATKRVLRYLKCTQNAEMIIIPSTDTEQSA